MHLKMIHSRTYTITLHTHSAFSVMNELRQKQDLCDIVLCLEDQIFHAHKVVLAGCSPYLRAMFTNGMKETAKNHIEIHGVDPVAMEIILTFMYTGKTLFIDQLVRSKATCSFNCSIHCLVWVC